MRTRIAMGLAAMLLWAGAAAAQTATTQPATAAPATTEGAFDRLSPGNQKIARALFEAQATSGAATAPSPTPLTLDEIAVKKLDGQGWGNVFKDMKAQGLVQEKNLGQVVSRSNRHHGAPAASSGTVITTASGRTYVTGGRGRGDHGAARNDSGHGAGNSGGGYGRGGEAGRHGAAATTGRGGEHGSYGRAGGGSHGGGRSK